MMYSSMYKKKNSADIFRLIFVFLLNSNDRSQHRQFNSCLKKNICIDKKKRESKINSITVSISKSLQVSNGRMKAALEKLPIS